MKLTKIVTSVLFAVSAMSVSTAMAAENDWYVGANIGQSKANIDDKRITEFLTANGFSSSIKDNDKSFAGKFYSGYNLNQNFSVEFGYFNLGNLGYFATTTPQGTLDGNMKVSGLNLDLVGTLPVTKNLSAFGRFGVTHAHTRDRFVGTGAVNVINPNPRSSDNNLKAGIGLQYAFTDNLSVRGEFERYRINDAVSNRGDVDMISVGLVYRFGAKPSKVVFTETMPAPIPAYLPAPIVERVTVVESKPIMRINLSADSLFDFNKSTIKPEGKAALDDLGSKLNGVTYSKISVVGHTDRIGSDQYNQSLSEDRANAVKDYLVTNLNISSNSIYANGVGESQATMNEKCQGTKKTPKLIACLQPDRRVDIEVEGTR